jgi:methyl coenzyme M reductase subunit D
MEAELSAGCDATKQAAWLRQILEDLHVAVHGLIRYFCDNQGAISAAANPGQHDKRKHIGMKAHYVTDEVKRGRVAFEYIPTEDNVADILTKPLDRHKTAKFARALGLLPKK